ncbi:MAG TPA: hypothetical protein VMZ69_03325 [Saprospiraceae bacterium]|nr:hypothetical protein [Saprospiraceae bacterium]
MANFIQAHFKIIVCAWLVIASITVVKSQDDIYWTTEAKAAYGLIMELRIEESLDIIRLQSITHPENLIWPYLQDYAIFLQIFVREDIKRIPDFLENSAERIDRVSVIPETNPMSLMCQAQMNLHQCALRLQLNQYAAGASDLNRAFKLLRKNQKLHPDDYANLRLYASLKIAFGAVPDEYRWLVSMVTSLSGTIDEGIKELNLIIQNSDPVNNIYHAETVLITALAEGQLNNKPATGVELLYKHFGKVPQNKIVQYIMANLFIAAANNDAAIRTLLVDAGAATAERLPFLDFMLGKCKLYRGDDDADIYFKNFLLFHKGTHYIKESYQKLAWYSLTKGDRQSYFDYMQLILIKGKDETDGDKQAMQEAEKHEVPHPELLRARLFFDGGYYEKASSILNEELYNTLTHRAHRLEYLYRKGRLLHELKSYAEALHYYTLTIRGGEHEPYYYACSAALHCGMIHESLGSEGAAERYYLICLQINPETYATSLHQKARTGLSRMGR